MKKKYVEPTVLLLDYVVDDVIRMSFGSNYEEFPDDFWD